VVADQVGAVVLGVVFEAVFHAPAADVVREQRQRAAAQVGGQDLRGRLPALEDGDLPAHVGVLPAAVVVAVEADHLVGERHRGRLAGARPGDRAEDGQVRGGGQRGAAVRHPVRAHGADLGEHRRVGGAPVEAEQDLPLLPGGLAELAQRRGQRRRQRGGLPGGKPARPAVPVDD
jgi:hypothetical protein